MTMRCFVSAVLAGVSVSGAAEVLTDDPAVISTAGTYAEPFVGTGDNAIVFKGGNDKNITVDNPVRDFASAKIEDGTFNLQENAVDFLPGGNLSLETSRLRFWNTVQSSGTRVCHCATNGTVTFGADSVIGIRNNQGKGSPVELHLGRLSAASGGTLLFSAYFMNGSKFVTTGFNVAALFGNTRKFFVEGVEDGYQFPANFIGGAYAVNYTPHFFVKYDAENGVVPDDMVSGFDAATEDDIVLLDQSPVSLEDDVHVRGLVISNYSTADTYDNARLEIPSGKTLTLGNGVDPAGMIIRSHVQNSHYAVKGAGAIDFGSSLGVIWSSASGNGSALQFDSCAIKGTGGLVLAARQRLNDSWRDVFQLKNANWKWTGPLYIDDVKLTIADQNLSTIDNDIYIRGNTGYGASIYHSTTGSGTYNFNGKMFFTGPGAIGRVSGSYGNHSFGIYRNNTGKKINLNNTVTVEHNVIFSANGTMALTFNGAIEGSGNVVFPAGSLNIYFNAANTYAGSTTLSNGTLCVQNNGTLGKGDVGVYGTIQFSNKSGYAMGNAFSGTGDMKLVNSSLVFSNDVSIGTLTFDANSSAAFGGAVSASTRLTFPAGAEMSALDGASPTLTVTNGTVFAGNLSDIDIVCDGVVTNRGTLAVTRIGANKRLDPIVIDGDAVFENATFEISGIADAMGGTHTVLSVTGAVEGEPTFSFPEGKVYAVTRTGNDWSIEKKTGLVLFVR